jgi:hypothetical protein
MTKKSFEINFVIDDYTHGYDANMFPFKEFENLDLDNKVEMLNSITRSINLYLDIITGQKASEDAELV